MISLRYTRNLLVRSFCVVYLFAFISFYIQIPGLYGNHGILPVKSLLESTKHTTFSAKIHYQPTLLWLTPYLGLNTSYALDFLALLGVFLAFTGFTTQKFCSAPLFAGLWSLYYSLYQVGQVFVSNHYDELLLEAGFLLLFVAALLPGKKKGSKGSPTDHICFWLVKWLLFRFLATSGLVKLVSGCSKWWSLTAFEYYFETQPLPSPLAWYFHNVPSVHLKLFTVTAYVCEILLPFTFFMPFRLIRITAFFIEIWLNIWIVLTGNFNFVNILVITLLISLLDDDFFYGNRKSSSKRTLLEHSINVLVFAAILGLTVKLFALNLNGTTVESNVAFTWSQFNDALKMGLPYVLFFGVLSLAIEVLQCIFNVVTKSSQDITSKFVSFLSILLYTTVALVLLFSSTVPLAALHSSSNSTVQPVVRSTYERLHKLRVVNQYGLFSKMIGVDGRREIILEGANTVDGPWLEYNFLYKPGNVNRSLPFVAPYSPRLDWQMFWAAYSTYDKEPWILSFAHRLLNNRHEVLQLLDLHQCAFSKKPPKYIRASLYQYKYSKWSERSQQWWIRQRIGEYFPAYSKDSPELNNYLKARNLLPALEEDAVNLIWKQIFDSIRYVTEQLEATLLLWSIFTASCAIITTSSWK